MAIETGENKYKKYGQPSLDLVFTSPKSSLKNRADSGAVEVEFSRTQDTPSSYVKSDGTIGYASTDVPRFDHDPTTGESLGLLIEESRTNFATRSDDFITSSTNTNVIVIPNSAVAPDGKFTATKIVDDSTNAEHYVQHPAVNGIVQTNSVHSIFAKAAELDTFELRTQNTTTIVRFTLSGDGTATPISGASSASIEKYPNGWYKCSYVANFLTTLTNPRIALYNGAQSYVGDGSGIYVWGLQFENQVTFGTSYITTTPTFTSRASEATYYDENGIVSIASTDVARDDAYFPDENGNFISAGLLLEESRTNVVPYSETFQDNGDDTGWRTANGTVTLSAGTAPDGGSAASVEGYIYKRLNWGPAGTSNSTSVYVKAGTATTGYITGLNGNAGGIDFDLSTGTISDDYTNDSKFIEPVGNGWFRIGYSRTSTSTLTAINLRIGVTGTGTILFWGVQTEMNTSPTSYIPTTAGISTRAADISSSGISTRGADTATISGVNYSNNFDPHPTGTVYCEYNREYDESTNSSTRRPWTFSRGTTNNNVQIRGDGSGNEGFYLVDGGTTSIVGVTTVVSEGVFRKTACAWDNTTMSASFGNVGIATTTMNSSLPFNSSIDEFSIGSYPSYSNTYLMGHVKRLTYWSRRLPDSDLQSLTE